MSQTSPTDAPPIPGPAPRLGRRLRLGLVGCGRAAERIYLPMLGLLAGAHLAAAADPRPERRELIVKAVPECRSFDSADALFAAGIVDAVIVTTPPESHVTIVTLALEAGLPALVEKPLALTAEGLPSLARLTAETRLPLLIGFNRRYWTPVRQLRTRLQQCPRLDNAQASLLFISNQGAWNPIETVGDPLEDLGSHQLDLLSYLFDSEITTVSARWEEDGGPSSGIHMLVQMACGATAECRAARTGSSAEWIRVEDGSAENRHYHIHPGSEQIEPAGGPARLLLDIGDALGRRLLGRRSSLRRSYELQLRDFLALAQASVLGQDQPTSDIGANIEAGVAAVQAVDAARRSADQAGLVEAPRP